MIARGHSTISTRHGYIIDLRQGWHPLHLGLQMGRATRRLHLRQWQAARTSGTVHSDGRQRYRGRKRDCDACPLRLQCCPKASPRYVARDVHEDAPDVARRKMKTKAFLKSRDQRKRVEMRFAHLKTHYGFERLPLRDRDCPTYIRAPTAWPATP
jgi:hypothetical protein